MLAGEPLTEAVLRDRLDVKVIGRRIEVHDEVTSTNVIAKERAGDPDFHGMVIFAERQSRGRGRLNRVWHSPRGASVLCSTLLYLDPSGTVARTIWLWSVLAAHEAIRDAADIVTQIKWPNDLMARGKKLCGILIESIPLEGELRAYVIGIGINCLQHAGHFPPDLRSVATSLDLESATAVDRVRVAKELLTSLDVWYDRANRLEPDEIKARWTNEAIPLGRYIRVVSDGHQFSGSLVDLDPDCGIVLQLDEGGRRLFSPYTTTIESMEA